MAHQSESELARFQREQSVRDNFRYLKSWSADIFHPPSEAERFFTCPTPANLAAAEKYLEEFRQLHGLQPPVFSSISNMESFRSWQDMGRVTTHHNTAEVARLEALRLRRQAEDDIALQERWRIFRRVLWWCAAALVALAGMAAEILLKGGAGK